MVKDFSKGKIYKIVNNENNLFYIGSTISTLCKRMGKHRETHNTCMVKNIGVDLKYCSIILIENYPCKDNNELLRKEREYFDKYKAENKEVFLNKHKPILYEGEYKEYKKEYFINNKKKLKQQQKEYQQRPEIKEKSKKKQKEYQQRPEIKEKRKKYMSTPEYKEKIKEKQKIKITCICGSSISKSNKSIHIKSKKHIKFISENP